MSTIPQVSAELSSAVAAYASSVASNLTDLKSQIANTTPGSVWIDSVAPSDPSKYVAWLKVTPNETDLLFNYGSVTVPIWISPIKVARVPTEYGKSYRVSESNEGKFFNAVRIDAGKLPNDTIKLLNLPGTIISNWGPIEYRTIDLTNSYLRSSNDVIVPLSHVFGPSHPDCNIELRNGMIAICTSTDLSDWSAVITLKYRLA